MIRSDMFLCGEQMKVLDGNAIGCGVSEKSLMENAGNAIFRQIKLGFSGGSVAVVCGSGNNGGDGYAVACLLADSGYDVCIVRSDPPKGKSSAFFESKYNGKLFEYSKDKEAAADAILSADCVVDALFGFSFSGKLSGVYAELTELINSTHATVISADLPSGVSADGTIAKGCVMADITCTFTVNKPATVSYPGYEYCGKVVLCDIGVPKEAFDGIAPFGRILGNDTLNWLSKRPINSNKGTFGTLLALCGSPNMTGAAYLAAMGALRSGVGLLQIVSDNETLGILKTRLSEPVFLPFESRQTPRKYSAFLVGCGIGNVYDNVLADILKQNTQSAIIDADGINYISGHINVLTEMQGDIILTPHPGEMARLMGKTVEYVNQNRIECARSFAEEFGCVVVLKGNRTVIASPKGEISVCTNGGSALAKGGSGDVLAGVIASLAAQGVSPYRAACIGVYAHGLAGDNLSAEYGNRGVLPHDLPKEIGRILG